MACVWKGLSPKASMKFKNPRAHTRARHQNCCTLAFTHGSPALASITMRTRTRNTAISIASFHRLHGMQGAQRARCLLVLGCATRPRSQHCSWLTRYLPEVAVTRAYCSSATMYCSAFIHRRPQHTCAHMLHAVPAIIYVPRKNGKVSPSQGGTGLPVNQSSGALALPLLHGQT